MTQTGLYTPCTILYNKVVTISTSHDMKVGDCMGMTTKQFQGFVRLTLAQIDRALAETPDNKELQELKDIFQNMLEDGN